VGGRHRRAGARWPLAGRDDRATALRLHSANTRVACAAAVQPTLPSPPLPLFSLHPSPPNLPRRTMRLDLDLGLPPRDTTAAGAAARPLPTAARRNNHHLPPLLCSAPASSSPLRPPPTHTQTDLAPLAPHSAPARATPELGHVDLARRLVHGAKHARHLDALALHQVVQELHVMPGGGGGGDAGRRRRRASACQQSRCEGAALRPSRAAAYCSILHVGKTYHRSPQPPHSQHPIRRRSTLPSQAHGSPGRPTMATLL
jgi:hypothetical protein